jgi:hypothetical protein
MAMEEQPEQIFFRDNLHQFVITDENFPQDPK